METKKNMRASLEDKRLLMAEAGLVLALLAVYGAFEYAVPSRGVALLENTTRVSEDDDVMPVIVDTPPSAPEAPALPLLSEDLLIVDDDVLVDVEFQSLEENGLPLIPADYRYQEVVEESAEEETLPWISVEQEPSFNGGDANAFSQWVNARLQYPEIARENGIEGRVTLQFTVGSDGNVFGVKVLRGVDELLDKEAVRIVSSSPKWTPGKQRDKAVKVTYTFPVIFQLR